MKVPVATRLDPEVAQALCRLALEGNRSLSREVGEACRRHVMLELFSSQPPAGAAVSTTRSPHGGPQGEQ
jgi:hypothetical protein